MTCDITLARERSSQMTRPDEVANHGVVAVDYPALTRGVPVHRRAEQVAVDGLPVSYPSRPSCSSNSSTSGRFISTSRDLLP